MENLEIISTQVTVQAKQVINGNTVNLSWNFNQGSIPKAVNFSVQRNAETPLFTGNNVITGAFFSETEKFDVQNGNFKDGDFALYEEILAICRGIVNQIEEAAR